MTLFSDIYVRHIILNMVIILCYIWLLIPKIQSNMSNYTHAVVFRVSSDGNVKIFWHLVCLNLISFSLSAHAAHRGHFI